MPRSARPFARLRREQRALYRYVVVSLGSPRRFWVALAAVLVLNLLLGALPGWVSAAAVLALLVGWWRAGRWALAQQLASA